MKRGHFDSFHSFRVVSHTTVIDPTIRQPGFDLPRHTWSLMNRFRTGQDPCRANLHKWGLALSPSCDCGQRQTMNHVVDVSPLTKFEGGLNLLHEAVDDAVIMARIYSDCSTRETLGVIGVAEYATKRRRANRK